MAGRTFSAILSGGRYPESMYFAVLERIRAEKMIQMRIAIRLHVAGQELLKRI